MFGRNKTPAGPVVFSDPTKTKLAWIQRQPETHFLTTFDSFRTDLINAILPLKYSELGLFEGEEFNKVLNYLSLARQTFLKIERQYMNQDEGYQLYNLLYASLPATIRKFRKDFIDYDQDIDSACDGMEIVFIRAYELINSIATNNVHHRARIGEIPLASSLEDEGDETLKLPIFTSENQKLQLAFEQLQTIWSQAYARKHIVENEFFIEQVAKSYLPEALNLYSSFATAPKAQKDAADKILLNSFIALETKIFQILAQVMESNLAELQAHDSFLNDKVDKSDTSALSLKKPIKKA